jgi:hypothetical protein
MTVSANASPATALVMPVGADERIFYENPLVFSDLSRSPARVSSPPG